MSDYIELKRNFVPVAQDAEPDLSIGPLWGRKYGGWLDWAEVLDHARVVLLAEAQSGKTEEFKHAALGLRDGGHPAFYATIEQLAEGHFSLSPPERTLFDSWKKGSGHAWFFLDSVDEARLNRKRFDDALRQLAAEVATELDRATVLISCRVSDWKGKSDRRTILDILPVPPPPPLPVPGPVDDRDAALLDPIFEHKSEQSKKEEQKKKKPDLLVIRLVPLSDEQRRIFAQANGIRDLDKFMEAIERQGLDALAERPGDMLELIQYWLEHNQFGTLTAMTEAAVNAKLSEPDKYRPDNAALSLAKAREGAERLAAGLTLGKTFTLIAPGQEPDPHLASGALDPQALLTDWTTTESNALMRRGIFAPATYGRIRFHHRSTQEYLTACWLKRLRDSGGQSSEIFTLLFAEAYGVKTVVPSLRSAAAWLAQYDPEIRDEIIRREPLMLVTHADPAALSSDAKAKVLLNFARRHAAGDIADDSIDRRALGMFGSPDLSNAIHEAWKINSRPDFRVELIRLIREGPIKGCIDLAARMAADEKERDFHRLTAIDALGACNAHPELKQIAHDIMRDPSKVGPGLAAGFAKALFPKYLTTSQLITLIDKSTPPSSNSVEGFGYIIDELWRVCPSAERPVLLGGLAELCVRPPFVDQYHRISSRQKELASHLGRISYDAVSALGSAVPAAAVIELLAVVERADRPPRLDEGPPLNELVRQTPAVHRALFWHDVEEVRTNSGHPVQGWWQVHFGGSALWRLGISDLPWLRADLATKTLQDDRRVALSAVANLLHPDLKAEAAALRKLIGKDSLLRKELNTYLRPPKLTPAMRRENRESARYEEQRKAQRLRDQASWREFRDKLLANPAELSDPSKVVSGFTRLHNLGEWLHRKTRQDHAAAVREWRLLGPAFSPEIAERYRDAMKALWRVRAPEKPVRQPGGPIAVKWITIYCYAAVGLEAAENPQFVETLSDSDVRRAVQHACFSEQGYPDWLDRMIAAHPKISVPIVADAFREEWTAEQLRASHFLYHFARNEAAIQSELQNAIFDVIAAIDPKQATTLDSGLDIVRNLTLSKTQRGLLRAMAIAHFNAHKKLNPAWAARYAALLFLLDGPLAAATLIAWLRRERPRKRKALITTVLGLLFGTHHPLAVDALAPLPVTALSQLVLFAYQEIRPDEDNVHEGSYTPDDRDEAEHARNAILTALVDNEGRAAYEAMIRLARHRDMKDRRIRFRELARRMAERDADVTAWRPPEVLGFEHDKILPAKSAPQLYKLVQVVINQIGWEFNNADASARSLLETARDENAVQEWLAAELKHRAKNRYHVSRESEVAEGNMPDILVSGVGALVEVAVEAKHGGKEWSTNALEQSLRTQLAEDYLRPMTRRHGVFVVTNHRKRGWMHPTTGRRLPFAEMINYLNGVATTLKRNSAGGIAVTVIGIDAVKKPRKRAGGVANRPRRRKKSTNPSVRRRGKSVRRTPR